ncbi:MAG TPA: glutathione S-transferase family protein [Rhizomicrobium sp.]|nr:glutathione S-transferase family protein [Rhizomicrobium sp.]
MTAHYTLVVGTKNWSTWSLRPYLALRATGAPFEEVKIKLRQDSHPSTKEQILKHSPAGWVPILKIAEDGREHIVWDSLAICETLAERHPEAKLWPDDAFRRAEARSYSAEMHSGFGPMRVYLSMDMARSLPMPDISDDAKANIARVIEAWTSALERFGHDGGFLFGRYSIADCMYAPVCSRFRTYGVEVPPIVEGYIERIFALPAMQDWLKESQAEVAEGLPDGAKVALKK